MTDHSFSRLGSDPGSVGTDWIPTDPARYEPSDHFIERVEDPDRFINEGWANRAISNGDLEYARKGSWKFMLSVTGVRVKVVCGLGRELRPTLISGYAIVDNFEKARLYGDYDERKLRCAYLRNSLAPGNDGGGSLGSFRLRPPTRVRGHDLVAQRGRDAAYCPECGREFEDLSQLKSNDCR